MHHKDTDETDKEAEMIKKADEILKDLFFMAVVIIMLSFAGFAFASDIDQPEVREDISVWKLDTVRFLVFTETAEITYRKGYMDDSDFVGTGEETTILFMNVEDDISTPSINEEKTEFTDLINLINNENNIKQSITKAVKFKLGI